MPARVCREIPYGYDEQSERMVVSRARSHNPRESCKVGARPVFYVAAYGEFPT